MEAMDGRMKSSRDGGWGWMIVAASFVTLICTRSVSKCVSIFFVEFQVQFSTDYSTTSWIHSLLDCTTMICAPLGSYVGNRLSTRVAVMTGGLLSSVGLVLSSFATSLQFLYISLGVLTGLGFALSYTPALAIVGTYFSEKKALAYGVAMSGRGIGIFLLPPLVQYLIDLYSWRGALLTLGGLASHLCVCGSLMRPLVGQSNSGKKNVKQIQDVQDVQEDLKEDTEREEETGLLRSQEGPDSHEGEIEKVKDSNQVEVKAKEEEHEEYPADLTLTDTQMTGKSKDFKQDSKTELATLSVGSVVRDSNLVRELTKPNLAESLVTEQQMNESKRINLMLADTKQTDSKLEDSMLNDLNIVKLMLAQPKLATSKQHDSQLLCETVSPEGPAFLIKHLRKPKCCRIPRLSEKHSFLFRSDFLLLSASFLFLAFGCSVPFVYLVPYSLSVNISHHHSVLLMSILGVMGIVGNITFGWISDRKCLKTYRVVTFLIAVGFEGLSCLFVPLLRSFPTLVSFSVVYGLFDGAFVALIPVVTCDIVGPAHLSTALGVIGFLHAIPYLISPPIAGWLLDQSGSYTAIFLLSGLSLLCSTVILTALAFLRHCYRKRSVLLPNQHQA